MKTVRGWERIRGGILLLMGALMLAGCASVGSKSTGTPGANALAEKKDSPQYLDFSDVLIPRELSVDRDNSFVFKTNGKTVGLLCLSGRVEMNSLISFFNNNMIKDNWRLISYFKSKRTLMLFKKDMRWCMIDISESNFYTHVKIWVSASVGNTTMDMVK